MWVCYTRDSHTSKSRDGWCPVIQLIYRDVVIAKLTCASSSWWGFTSASDRQRLEGFLRRGRRYGLYPADQPTIVQLIEDTV